MDFVPPHDNIRDRFKYEENLEKVREFFHAGRKITLRKDEQLIDVDDRPELAYWIESGFVRTFTIESSGHQRIHKILGPNEIISVNWILADAPLIASYAAMNKVTLYHRTMVETQSFLADHPEALIVLAAQMLSILTLSYGLRLVAAKDKVMYRLLSLSEKFGLGEAANGYVQIRLPQTQEEFASSIGLRRETVGRVFSQLEADNVIIIGRKVIRVQQDKLRQLLNG